MVILIAGGEEATECQDPDKVGTALKTLSMRLRAATTELEEAGESTEGVATSMSDLRGEILALTGQRVDIQIDSDTFKSTYDILKELSAVWDDLSDVTQASLLETIAGKNQANVAAAILDNFETAEEVVKTVANSAGSALNENEKYLESIEGRITNLKAIFESISIKFIDSDTVKLVVQVATKLLEIVDTVMDLTKGVSGLAKVVGVAMAAASLKNASFSLFSVSGKSLSSLTEQVNIFGKSVASIGDKLKSVKENGLSSLFSKKSGDITLVSQEDYNRLLDFNSAIIQGDDKVTAYNKTMQGAGEEASNLAKNCGKTGVSIQGVGIQADGSRLKLLGLKLAASALSAVFASLVAWGIQAALTAIANAFDDMAHSAKNASEAADEAFEASSDKLSDIQEESESLKELIARYEELASSDNVDASTRKEIAEVQRQINDLVDTQGTGLDLVNGKLQDQLAILQKITGEQNRDTIRAASNTLDDALVAGDAAIGSQTGGGFLGIGKSDGYEVIASLTEQQKEALSEWDYMLEKLGSDYGLNFEEYMYHLRAYYNDEELTKFLKASGQITVDTLTDRLSVLDSMLSAMETTQGYSSSEFYKQLVEAKEYYQGYADNISTAVEDVATSLLDAETSITNATVNTAGGFESSLNSLVSMLAQSDQLKASIEQGYVSVNSIIDDPDSTALISLYDFVESYLAGLDNFSAGYNAWAGNQVEIVEETATTLEDKTKAIKEVFRNSFGEDGIDARARNSISEFNEWLSSLSENDLDLAYEISLDTESAEYTLGEWQKAVENARFHFSDLLAEDDTDESDSFTTKIENYKEKVSTLKEALEEIAEGDFTNESFSELIEQFPELAVGADELNDAILREIESLTGYSYTLDDTTDSMGDATGVMAVFEDAFNRLDTDEDRQQLLNFMDTVLDLETVVGNTAFAIDIDAESSGLEDFWSAVKESVTSTGLTSDSIDSLKDRYKSLAAYDPSTLFETTANGVHLNTKALRELEAEYEATTKQGFDDQIANLTAQYNDLTQQINNADNAMSVADLYAQRQNIKDQLVDVSLLAAEYEGLTSDFYKWEQAQSLGEEGDNYDSFAGALEDIIDLYDEGLIGTNKFRTAVQLMTNKDLTTAAADELVATYQESIGKIQRYFTEGQEGVQAFLSDVQALNAEWAHMNEDGSWEINFGVGNDQEIADALGINVESVQNILRKLADYGFDVILDSAYSTTDLIKTNAEDAIAMIQELGLTDLEFNVSTTNLDYLEQQIAEAKSLLDTFRTSDGTIDLTIPGAQQTQDILSALISQKQSLSQPEIMSIDTSQISEAQSDLANAISLMQQLTDATNNLELQQELELDTTETEQKIQSLVEQINGLDPDIMAQLGVNTEEFNTAVQNIVNTTIDPEANVHINQDDVNTVQTTIDNISGKTVEVLTTKDLAVSELQTIDDYKMSPKTVYVLADSYIFDMKAKAVQDYQFADKWVNIKYRYFGAGAGLAEGTANAEGTAKAGGDWRVGTDGVSLGGEEKPEIVVRDGRWFTIGKDSAEFFHHEKGDIIFNGDQSEQILKYGRITSGKRRGTSYASGTAFSSGSGSFFGTGGKKNEVTITGTVTKSPSSALASNRSNSGSGSSGSSNRGSGSGSSGSSGSGNSGSSRSSGSGSSGSSGSNSGSGSGSGSSSGSSSSSSSSSAVEEASTEIVDWIEIMIDRIERAVDNLTTIASASFRELGQKLEYSDKTLDMLGYDWQRQQEAMNRYLQQAESVGLSRELALTVQGGNIDISEYDEDTANAIEEYQKWF